MRQVGLFTDEPVLAAGLVSVVSSAPEFRIAAVYRTTAELTEAIPKVECDVALVDLTPDITFDVLTQLSRAMPGCPIVLWVRDISPELAHQAIQLGVRGILRKCLASDLILKCLSSVCDGELWLDKALTANMLTTKMIPLTRREGQLVMLLSVANWPQLARMAPEGLDRVFFANSSSEAVDTALKIALAYHRARGEGQRTRFIGRERGYHGVGFGGMSVGGMANNRRVFGPMLPGVDHLRPGLHPKGESEEVGARSEGPKAKERGSAPNPRVAMGKSNQPPQTRNSEVKKNQRVTSHGISKIKITKPKSTHHNKQTGNPKPKTGPPATVHLRQKRWPTWEVTDKVRLLREE